MQKQFEMKHFGSSTRKKTIPSISRDSVTIPTLIGSPPGVSTVQPASSAGVFSEWLRQSLSKSTIGIGLMGPKGVGKSFLANVLLESSFQDLPDADMMRSSSSNHSRDGRGAAEFWLMDQDESQMMMEDSGATVHTMDESFATSYNWRSEKEAKAHRRNYWHTNQMDSKLCDRYCFLFPQGADSPQLIVRDCTVTYGKVPLFYCKMMDEKSLRNFLWQLHVPSAFNTETMQTLQFLYRKILGLDKTKQIPLHISSSDAFVFPMEWRKMMGQTLCFKGRGQNVDLDRIYLREKFRELTERYGAIMENIVFQMPCTILKGNRQLTLYGSIEICALFGSKPRQVAESNLMIVGIDHRGVSSSTLNFLNSTGFFSNFLAKNEEHKLVFVALTEKGEVESTQAATQMMEFKSRQQVLKARTYILSELKKILEEQQSRRGPFSSSPEESALMTKKAIQSVNLLYCKPLLYSSFHLSSWMADTTQNINKKFACSGAGEAEQLTNIPALLACVQNTVLSKCRNSLNEFNNNWMLKMKNMRISQNSNRYSTELNSIGMNTIRISKAPSNSTERLLESFHQQMNAWKSELSDAVNNLSSFIHSKAAEINGKQTIVPSNVHPLNFLANSITEYWQNGFVNVIPEMCNKMINYNASVLKDLSKIIKLPVDVANEQEKMKLLQMLKFCTIWVEKWIRTKMEEYRMTLSGVNINSILRGEENNNNNNSIAPQPRVMLGFQRQLIPENLVKRTITNLSSSVMSGIQAYNHIEKTAEHAIEWLLGTPYLKSSQVMNFVLSHNRSSGSFNKSPRGSKNEVLDLSPAQDAWEIEQLLQVPNMLPSTAQFILGFHQVTEKPAVFSIPIWDSLLASNAAEDLRCMNRFGDQLQEASLEIVSTTRVNSKSSQFRAFSYLVYGSEEGHSIVRLLLMNEILSKPSTYLRLILDRGNRVFAEKERKRSETLTSNVSSSAQSFSTNRTPSASQPVKLANSNSTQTSPPSVAPRKQSGETIWKGSHPEVRWSNSVEEYVYKMSHDNQEGDTVSLLAFCHFYNVDLFVYSPRSEQPILITPNSIQTAIENVSLSPMSPHDSLDLNSSSSERQTFGLAILEGREYRALVKKAKPALSNIDVEEELKKLDSLQIQDDQMEIPSSISMDDISGKEEETETDFYQLQLNNRKHHRYSTDVGSFPTNGTRRSLNDGMSSIMEVDVMDLDQSNNLFSSLRCAEVPTLSDMFVKLICRYAHHLPDLEGTLPEEMVQKILNHLLEESQLNDGILKNVIHPHMHTLSLEGYKRMGPVTCQILQNNCSSLRRLNLGNCWMMPPEDFISLLPRLSNLTDLNLESFDKLDSLIVNSIASFCPKLKNLNLTGCTKLSDSSLQSIFQACSELDNVILTGCTSIADSSFSSAPKSILHLNLTDCFSVSFNAMEFIGKRCLNLQIIKVAGSSINDTGLAALCQGCRSLQHLEINDGELITDTGLQLVTVALPQLHTLYLSGAKNLTDRAFGRITQSNLRHTLQHLNLSKCVKLTGDGVKELVDNCYGLKTLLLNASDMTMCDELNLEVMTHIVSKCTNLTSIDFSGCNHVDDSVISVLTQNNTKLEKINLHNCSKITDQSLFDIALQGQKLTQLVLNCCDKITDNGLNQIARNCRDIRVLSLEECNFTDRGIAYISYGCPKLEQLNLAFIKYLTDDSIQHLSNCKELQGLDLSFSPKITIPALQTYLPEWTKLRALSMRGFQNISTVGFKHPNLRVINLSWCKTLTDSALDEVVLGCPNVEQLIIARCIQVTSKAIHNLSRSAPFLRALNIRGCSRISVLMVKFLSSSGATITR
eukprot:TRINITY_DN5656_c0_g1_i1.p1 TRINITY_DN5656_c0_g1~~TRINITY_DN5656_c0_g1_i1.p1  ORF type:complete len:1811 (+),score=620.32 TRINITY_DN5656_c0_g1_i1:378-5810(+)